MNPVIETCTQPFHVFYFLRRRSLCQLSACLSLTQWTRWMQVVDVTSFLLLSIWWAVSAALFLTTRGNIAAGDGMLAASGNSTVPVPNLAQDATAASGMRVSNGLQFAMLGSSVCYICSTQVHTQTHIYIHCCINALYESIHNLSC